MRAPPAPVLLSLALAAAPLAAQPLKVLDLAALDPADGAVRRVYGATGEGRYGVPVAGGWDLDGDGHADYAVAYMTASPFGRTRAGEVDLVFGDGALGGTLDTAAWSPRVLKLAGAGREETAGNEIWIDDVTGDGLGDLLICRQNFSPGRGRPGAGALTILVGGPGLRRRAADLRHLDLAAPPPDIPVVTLVGGPAAGRFCIWVRTGDLDGDGVADLVVGADREGVPGEPERGAVYLVRGGPHLAASATVDLRDPGAGALAGQVARVVPPPGSARFHLGATCQIADLDGDGRGEVLAAATLQRAGAALGPGGPHTAPAVGGAPGGALFIAWGDHLPPAPWPPGLTLDLGALPGGPTVLRGGPRNAHLGEEILGGGDFDRDGWPDLFVGDLLADPLPGRFRPGEGYVIYRAAALRGREIDLGAPPSDLRLTRILGPSAGALGGDTAAQGDFDGDGADDLAFASPYAEPNGRVRAGAVHVLFGRRGGWPPLLDTAAPPPPAVVRVVAIQGARGADGPDHGDTLAYSAAAADLDGDHLADLIANEMQGNGPGPGAVDVGNLLLLDGASLSGDLRLRDRQREGRAGPIPP